MTYITAQDKQRIRRQRNRLTAIRKIAEDEEPKCVSCGCPHVDVLQIGFKKHREGRFHRKSGSRTRNVIAWVRKTPIEELRELVHLICPFCNSWNNKYKENPPEYKRPRWSILAS